MVFRFAIDIVYRNGKTQGISQPSAKAQEAVIRKAYAQAGNLDPRFTNYVECHGTGTQAGDPVELAAISKVFSPTRDSSNPLLVGSVKTNIGHGEAVSGISAIIKTVMAFERNSIPPNHGIKKLNPKIPFSAMAIDVVTSNRNWPSGIKRAGINSFGYGGANAVSRLECLLHGTSSTSCSTQYLKLSSQSYHTITNTGNTGVSHLVVHLGQSSFFQYRHLMKQQ